MKFVITKLWKLKFEILKLIILKFWNSEILKLWGFKILKFEIMKFEINIMKFEITIMKFENLNLNYLIT